MTTRKVTHFLAGLLLWLSAWQLIVLRFDLAGVIPPPTAVAVTMLEYGADLFRLAARPFAWAIAAWIAGVVLTIIIGMTSHLSTIVASIMAVPLAVGRTLPSVIAVPLFAAVAGYDRWSAFACATFLTISYSAPGFTASLTETLRLRRVAAECLGLSTREEFTIVSLPGVGRSLEGISIQSFGIALVVTIAGEMILGLQGSAGDRVAQWSWLLRMREVYALVVWLVLGTLLAARVAALIPRILLLPAKYRLRQIRTRISELEHS